jgi:addiction module HigA family antidote
MLDVTHNRRYPAIDFVGYRDQRTRDFAAGKRVKAVLRDRTPGAPNGTRPAGSGSVAWIVLPGNRFEALAGGRKGQYSIRINDQWRICFEWRGGSPGPSSVEIVDLSLVEEGAMAVTAIHPGEHLAEELKELGMSAAELARRLDVPTNRITGILNGQRAITGDTALRLAHFFGTSAEFWLNLQSLYELRIAQKKWGNRSRLCRG